MSVLENFPWDDFDKLHVIRRLKELVGLWWGVQVHYTDHKGFLRGVPKGKFFNPMHKVCQDITKTQKGFSDCIGTVRSTSIESQSVRKTKMGHCHAGFSTISVPLFIEQQYLGCVFADGFVIAETNQEQKIKIKNYLRARFTNDDELSTLVDQLPVLSQKDVFYLTQLIEMVVEEILLVYSDFSHVKKEIFSLKSELKKQFHFHKLVGKSSKMQELYELIEKVSDSSALVLIQGENGTGKELIAKALHYSSKRKEHKFIAINCAAFNENLLESELFGHVKGAFTGANKDKDGFFEAAGEGTLFLDEVGDMSGSMQVKLLRVLQDGTFTPVGGTEEKKSKARIVCASHKNLESMVKKGEFREDLYYRLNVINIVVPSLRDRKEDLPILIESFLENYAKNEQKTKKTLSSECLEILMNHNWPGNVRELENEVERLCVLSPEDPVIGSTHLSPRIRSATLEHTATGIPHSDVSSDDPLARATPTQPSARLKDALEVIEYEMIKDGLERTRWNKSKLARDLGISRASLIAKVQRFGLVQPKK